jgi:four helix bundle protein
MTEANDPRNRALFAHERLRAWHVAMRAMNLCHDIADHLGPGLGRLADQLRNASQSACLQVGEGAAKEGGERRQRFRGARSEASEAASALAIVAARRRGDPAKLGEAHNELGKLCAMLVKLERAA